MTFIDFHYTYIHFTIIYCEVTSTRNYLRCSELGIDCSTLRVTSQASDRTHTDVTKACCALGILVIVVTARKSVQNNPPRGYCRMRVLRCPLSSFEGSSLKPMKTLAFFQKSCAGRQRFGRPHNPHLSTRTNKRNDHFTCGVLEKIVFLHDNVPEKSSVMFFNK